MTDMDYSGRPACGGEKPGPAQGRDRGFALLLVLWTMSLLALLATQVTADGRSEIRLSSALTGQAQLQEAADAAITETIWHLVSGPAPWGPEIGRAQLAENGIDVDVTVIDERGKLDFNAASADLSAAFFAELGADRRSAHDLADRITEWRTGQLPQDDTGRVVQLSPPATPPQWAPPGRDFQRLEELRLIPGMTDSLYRAVLPHAVFHLDQVPLYRIADAVVRAAMDQNRRETNVTQAEPDSRAGYLVRLVAHARHAGYDFSRATEVRISGSLGNDLARYRVMAWE